MKSLNLGFYRTSSPIESEIQDKLTEFAANPRPHNISRTATIDGEVPILLRNILVEPDGSFLLDFTRIRDVPNQALSDLSGNEELISFQGKDKRPAEFTAVLFDTATRVLVIHEHLLGISHSMIGKFWQQMLSGIGKFRVDPIIKKDAVDRMIAAGAISKFSVKLASMGDPKLISHLGLAQEDVLDLIPFYNSPNVTVTLELGPKPKSKSLNVLKIRALITALLVLPKTHLKKLELVAEDEAGQKFPIDLLKDRIVHREQLDATESKDATDEIRYKAIRACSP